MNTQAQLPYLLLGVDATAPNRCVIYTSGTDKRPSMRHTMPMRPGEDDYAFWNRVERVARELADPFDLYPRSGRIEFNYECAPTNDDGDNGDSFYNRRMELHFWCRSDNAQIRVMAAIALGELCGLFPLENAAQARH
jgi:hypothetical protein